MRLKLTLLILLSCTLIKAGEIDEYMNLYRSSGKSEYKKEIQILKKNSFQKLTDGLTPFYKDSIAAVRQKAFYLTYKKSISSSDTIQQIAVLKLLSGCNDKNGGVVGNLYSYLQEFPVENFNNEAKNKITNLLGKKKIFHFKKLAKLAGAVGAGQEILQKKFIEPETNNETKWIISLALARQGSINHVQYLMEQVKNAPVNSNTVSYLIPDLIYTRQYDAINFCINIIHSNKKDCYSSNPDKPEFILCGYRIMELIAPVIIDFPYQIDATGTLITDDYEEALFVTRDWLSKNPNYQIRR